MDPKHSPKHARRAFDFQPAMVLWNELRCTNPDHLPQAVSAVIVTPDEMVVHHVMQSSN